MDDISNKSEAPTIRAPVEKPNIIEYEIDNAKSFKEINSLFKGR